MGDNSVDEGGPDAWLESAKSCARRAVEFEGVGQLPVAAHYYAEAGRLLRALLDSNPGTTNCEILIRYRHLVAFLFINVIPVMWHRCPESNRALKLTVPVPW
jgi:hypothetical protein